jgi:hypothetical protein
VGTEVGFRFHDAAGEEASFGAENQELAEEARGGQGWMCFVEGAG